MDARPGYAGYAAFGHVVGGMDVVRRILALPSGGGVDAMKGQMILRPVPLTRAVRIDGKARPTNHPRVWKLFERR
jgi:peptidyl-prolyl cis-trans isomerase A (cyclophilin A)